MDYYTQAALLPLHKYLFKHLSRIPQDCTFNQTKRFKRIRVKNGNSFHSVDLTTATDRFPIEIQYELLRLWFGNEYAKEWKNLMVGHPFRYKNDWIIYQTGNPMGAYSSWAIFTLCHHFFLWKACKKANRKWKKAPYMMLGDDIVIADDVIAKHYKELLAEWDIPFSKEKTHVSQHGFEFAKQMSLHGRNISPFPLSALYDRRSEAFICLGILYAETQYKDWNTDIGAVVKSYYIDILKWPRPKLRHAIPKINLVISLLSFLQGHKDLGTAIKEYVALWTGEKYDQLSIWDYSLYGNYLALLTVHDSFLRSRERVVTGNEPLGDLATEMVIHITSLRSEAEQAQCFELIEAVPFLQIYGRAEETFLSLNTDISVYMIGDKPTLFKEMFGKVNIPLSDTAFYERRRDVILNECLKAADIIMGHIKSIPYLKIKELDIDIAFPWSDKIKNPKIPKFDTP
jgi:hypothetical protein